MGAAFALVGMESISEKRILLNGGMIEEKT